MTNHTTFVVGAGAGVPFGMPTGLDLLEKICKEPLFPHLPQDMHPIERDIYCRSANRMCNSASNSGQLSIDAFLERRPEFLSDGTVQISAHLLPREWDAISSGRCTRDWIGWLFRAIEGTRGFRGDSISIVTFNYDRLIEAGLAIALSNSQDMNVSDAFKEVDRLSIVHVYGHLKAPNDPQLIDRSGGCPSGHWVREAAKGVQIIGSDRDHAGNANLALATQEVLKADRLVILGFAFDRRNMMRIGLQDWRGAVYSTAYNLAEQRKRDAEVLIGHSVVWGGNKEGALEFLERHISM